MGWLQNIQRAYGQFDKNHMGGLLPGGASREASPPNAVQRFAADVMDQGLIPVPTVTPAIEGGAKFVKSYAGPLGKPFRIEKSFIGRDEKFNKEIDRATRTGDDLSYGTRDKGYVAPSGVKEQLERGIFGQWGGKVDPKTGAVTVTEGTGKGQEAYDTNQDTDWHGAQFDKNWEAGNYGDALMDKVYQGYAWLQDKGWTNKAPQGSQPQIIGYTKEFRDKPQVDAKMAPPTGDTKKHIVDPQTEPATAYAVQAGDTLTAIAARRGATVAELVKRNNISNPDMIQVGQMIR